jgi:hypothetical protein
MLAAKALERRLKTDAVTRGLTRHVLFRFAANQMPSIRDVRGCDIGLRCPVILKAAFPLGGVFVTDDG